MAIEWSSARCVPPGPTSDVDAANRHALIVIGSGLGVDDLTLATVEEWLVRWRMEERYQNVKPDAWFQGNQTLPDVLTRWLGLEVNAGYITRNAWLGRRVAGWIDEVQQEAAEFVAGLRAEKQRQLVGGVSDNYPLDRLADRLFNGGE